MTMENCEDNLDETTSARTNESSPKTKIRRTRLKLLFDEFQTEISCLEEKVERLSSENAKLKSMNDDLRQQLDDSTELSMKIASETIDGSKINKDINNVGDISTIIKLSNKLQEMIHVNENITRVNAALRRDLKSLTNERDLHLQDISKLREENKFSRSPYSYSKYNVVTLKDKVDSYEREIQQWKSAMKRADDYIGELGKELEKYKRSNNNRSVTNTGGENDQIKDLSYSRSLSHSPVLQSENRKKRLSPLANSSATEALQKLVSKVDSSQCEPSTDDDKVDDASSDKTNLKNPILDLSNTTRSITPKPDDLEPPEAPAGNETGELFSDPIRFPACVKLLELTKARKSDESLMPSRSSPLNETNIPFTTCVSSDNHNNMLFWNNGMAFSNSSSSHGGPVVHHHAAPSLEDRSHKGDVEDDITIVLPSSDHSLSHPIPSSNDNSHSRDMLYNSPNSRSFDTSMRPRMDHEYNPLSENHSPSELNNGDGIVVVSNPSDYSYYPPNAYTVNHHYPPMKKIKIEDVYK